MTTAEVLGALARRWYVALAILAVTGAAMVIVHQRPGVYFTEVTVRFFAPAGTEDNDFVSSSASLVAAAGVVERSLQDPLRVAATASQDVTLPDRGIYEGVSVTLPDAGGQFGHLFDQPSLTVQAAGSSAAEAADLRDGRVREIRTVLRRLQVREGVPLRSRIEVRVISPLSVSYVQGRPTRAVAVIGMLGLGATILVCSTLDRLLRRRSSASASASGTGTTAG